MRIENMKEPILKSATVLARARMWACTILTCLALCPMLAQAVHPRLIKGAEVLFDEVPINEAIDRSEVEIIVLMPKQRCTFAPQQPGRFGFGLIARKVEEATALLACNGMYVGVSELAAPYVARAIKVDWSTSATAKDVLDLGVLEGSKAKRVLVIWWEFHPWREPRTSRGDTGWYTAEALGFDVASRRVIWHGLSRSGLNFGVTTQGPYLASADHGARMLIYGAFWGMNDRRPQQSAAKAGGRWLDDPSLAQPIAANMARLVFIDQGTPLGSGGWICPRADPPLPRNGAVCVHGKSFLLGTHTALELPPGAYTIVAPSFDDGPSLDIDIEAGNTSMVSWSRSLFGNTALRLVDAQEAPVLLRQSRLAHFPVGEHRREIEAELLWRER